MEVQMAEIKQSFKTVAPRRTLKEMQKIYYGSSYHYLSPELFGKDAGAGIGDILDFEMEDYRYLLDNVKSLKDLIAGLAKLSPLADDALDIAENMTSLEFSTFKLALIKEREMAAEDYGESCMPKKFMPLLLPERFIDAILIAKQAGVAMGVALIRLMEIEEKKEK